MQQYDPKTIEPKWQELWEQTHLYAAVDGDTSRPKYYMLTEFPYPSGAGLHAGHIREYTLGDVISRHRRMQGYNVLFPMGYDAFGLPTENYAIKNKVRPQDATATNIATFRQQFTAMGLSFDWGREVNTTDPDFYRWTQWLFLQFFKAGLAYQAEMAINWCPKEKTGLANEEVVDGKHERCGTPVEKKLLKQWMLKITDYADRLIDGLKDVDYPSRIADQQINWIGRSIGAEIEFQVAVNSTRTNSASDTTQAGVKITVYTTRPDTLAGATFLVLAPEHPAVKKIATAEQSREVEIYVKQAQSETDLNRQEESRPKTGVFTGAYTKNPITGSQMPIWIADYVLSGYGTGAIMAVPAHDERDNAFAKAMNGQMFGESAVYTDTTTPPRPNLDFEDRVAALAIVKHPHNETYLVQELTSWKSKIYAFPMGGIDPGEDVVTAACRELIEETGYDHIASAVELGAPYIAEFYHEHKKVNRRAHIQAVSIELEDLHQADVDEAEESLRNLHWLSGEDVLRRIHGEGITKLFKSHLAGYVPTPIKIISVIDPVFIRDDAKKLTEFKRHQKIVAVVENEKGEILTINWGPKLGGRLTIGGTVEPGEAPEATAVREIAEETGYHDVEIIDIGAETMQYKYFAFSKKEGHDVSVKFVHLRLKSDARQDVNLDESEKGNFTVEWVSRDVASKDIVEPLHRYAYDKFITGHIYAGAGIVTNSGQFNGLTTDDAKAAITHWLQVQHIGRSAKKYRLRDWIFSRQHYWGEPIPIIHCPTCGPVAVPDDQLPVKLPDVDHYEPTDNGQSPLAEIKSWVNTTCPQCGALAARETDTMPNWAGSSWYYLRYMDPRNSQAFAGRDKLDYWGMVDLYLGGMEHTTLHLLYSRFWHQFLFDQGLVPTPEPYAARRGQGIVLAADGRKMSKSLGNVVNPTDIIARYGADALRLYVLFMAPYDESTPWSDERLNGVSRFLYRVWNLAQELSGGSYVMADSVGYENSLGAFETEVDRMTHKTLKKVHDALESMRFNTVVSSLMEYVNFLAGPNYRRRLLQEKALALRSRTLRALILMLAPVAPHITEELWHQLGEDGSVHTAAWPQYDPTLIHDDIITVIAQVNGKVRAQITMPASVSEAEQLAAAGDDPNIARHLKGKTVIKTIVVQRKLVNFVIK